jgi:hypothetical protein
MMASSKLSISHQINDRRRRVDERANWRGAWWQRRASQGSDDVVVGSAVRRRLRKERVECGNYYGQQRRTRYVGDGRGSNAELANNDEGGLDRCGVCYGGICTVGVVVRAGKGGQAADVYEPSAAGQQSRSAPCHRLPGANGANPDLRRLCVTQASAGGHPCHDLALAQLRQVSSRFHALIQVLRHLCPPCLSCLACVRTDSTRAVSHAEGSSSHHRWQDPLYP